VRVAVIGCGAMGAATGWRLAKRGVQVVCFDRHSPPHALGSTHGETRITRTAYFEGPWYVPLLQETFPLWRELEQSSRAQLLTLTGTLMIGSPSSDVIRGTRTSASEHGLDVEELDAEEAIRRYPGQILYQDEVAIVDRQGGFVRAEEAVDAMIDQMLVHGGELRRNRIATSIDGRTVTSAEGSESFDAVVIAAGPWMPELVPWLPLNVERQVMVWLAIESGARWLLPERFPVFIRQTDDFGDIYGIPSLDGISMKVARHHNGIPTDPDHVQREVTVDDLDRVRAVAARYLNGVTDRVTKAAVCMYTNTPDHHFAIGQHPEDSRIVVLSACSGHGFKFAPVIGDIAADLICDGGTSRDISHISLERFIKTAT
jgi:sarcosine oxidase